MVELYHEADAVVVTCKQCGADVALVIEWCDADGYLYDDTPAMLLVQVRHAAARAALGRRYGKARSDWPMEMIAEMKLSDAPTTVDAWCKVCGCWYAIPRSMLLAAMSVWTSDAVPQRIRLTRVHRAQVQR